MEELNLKEAVWSLLVYAANGELCSQLNGYEADERDISDTEFRVCRLLKEDDARPTELRIERDGDIIAWATVDDDGNPIDVDNESTILTCGNFLAGPIMSKLRGLTE